MNRFVILAFTCLSFSIVAPANAAVVYSFTYSDGTNLANGTLTTGSPNGSGFDIIDITGIFSPDNGAHIYEIDGLLPADTCCSDPANDNILYFPATPHLDLAGLAFQDSFGNQVNLYFDDIISSTYAAIIGIDGPATLQGTFTLVPTPLPAALPLFATGLGMIGLIGWRRRRRPGLFTR